MSQCRLDAIATCGNLCASAIRLLEVGAMPGGIPDSSFGELESRMLLRRGDPNCICLGRTDGASHCAHASRVTEGNPQASIVARSRWQFAVERSKLA